MQTLAQRFLTADEQQRITSHVQQAERQTSGEIVPMVVSASHDYPLAAVIGATLAALPAGLLGSRLMGGYFWVDFDRIWLFIACFAAIFFISQQIIKRVPHLLRIFISAQQAEEEVKKAAMLAFFTEQLYKTKAENGILLYISVLEQRVWILADRGINERIDPAGWQEIVTMITEGVRSDQGCKAICAAIDRVGALLAKEYPIQPDDTNELHNLIIR